MRARFWLGLSLAANLALSWAVAARFHPPVPRVVPAAGPAHRTAAVAPPGETSETPAPAAAEVAQFQWAQLVSPDFKVYRDNLRGIGCPEQTVRDIITAEINAQYLGRRQVILTGMQSTFWELAAQHWNDPQAILKGDWAKPLKELEQERTQLIKEVLGNPEAPEFRPGSAEWTARANQIAGRYAWLPEAKRQQLLAWQQEMAAERATLFNARDQRTDKKFTTAEQARLDALKDEFIKKRDQLLTPEELAELKLRQSPEAGWAQNLPGFEVTESEWRAVAQARADWVAAHVPADAAQPGARSEPAAADMAQIIQTTLGADRLAQYQQASDGDYQMTHKVMARYGLADTVAQEVRDMQRVAEAKVQQVQGDASLTPEERQATLATLQQETERSLKANLGAEVFHTYQRYAGGWLTHLAPDSAD